MSDDLISRKAVIDYLREQNNNVIIEKHKNGFVSEDTCRGMESAISAFRNFILTLPTAFDKEKVIANLREELKLAEIEKERCITESPSQFQSAKGHANGVSFGLEIVEKGGVE